MAAPLTLDSTTEDAQYQAMAQHYLAEVTQVNQAMACDQQEIEQLQLETRRILAEMQLILHKIEAR